MRRFYPLLAVVALAGCGGDTSGKKQTVTDGGVVTVKRVDLKTGLEFKVQTAPGFGTKLFVTPTRDMPAGVRTELQGKRLRATCAVPGTSIVTLEHEWPTLDDPFESSLQTKGDVPVAERATGCSLALDGKTFSRVDL
jgi:hypothetical protein